MRWRKTQKAYPVFRTTRVRCGFLWWPKTIRSETRWLEWTCWREEWSDCLLAPGVGVWEPTHWMISERNKDNYGNKESSGA